MRMRCLTRCMPDSEENKARSSKMSFGKQSHMLNPIADGKRKHRRKSKSKQHIKPWSTIGRHRTNRAYSKKNNNNNSSSDYNWKLHINIIASSFFCYQYPPHFSLLKNLFFLPVYFTFYILLLLCRSNFLCYSNNRYVYLWKKKTLFLD